MLVIGRRVIGLLLGFGASQVLGTLLYGVGSGRPDHVRGGAGVLGGGGAVAAFLPARRAGRVDPASVLRAE